MLHISHEANKVGFGVAVFFLWMFSGWLRFHNKCYIIRGRHTHHEERANWTYARDWCRKQDGHLAIIDDINENGVCLID